MFPREGNRERRSKAESEGQGIISSREKGEERP
jgi:hypothetical protein